MSFKPEIVGIANVAGSVVVNEQERRDQLLVALAAAPLDRIRLMKTAFLVWYRNGKPESGPFRFEPYLYGPCSFELYHTLHQLQIEHLITQLPADGSKYSPYRLTELGKEAESRAEQRLGWRITNDLQETASWCSGLAFRSLLQEVYREAPDFATQSVLR